MGWHLLVRVQVDVKSFLTKVRTRIRSRSAVPFERKIVIDKTQLHLIDARTTGRGTYPDSAAREIFNALERAGGSGSERHDDLLGVRDGSITLDD